MNCWPKEPVNEWLTNGFDYIIKKNWNNKNNDDNNNDNNNLDNDNSNKKQ